MYVSFFRILKLIKLSREEMPRDMIVFNNPNTEFIIQPLTPFNVKNGKVFLSEARNSMTLQFFNYLVTLYFSNDCNNNNNNLINVNYSFSKCDITTEIWKLNPERNEFIEMDDNKQFPVKDGDILAIKYQEDNGYKYSPKPFISDDNQMAKLQGYYLLSANTNNTYFFMIESRNK